MILTLELTPELQERLRQQAELRGMSEGQFALEILDRHLSLRARKERLHALLESIIEECKNATDEETAEAERTLKAIDEDRLSDRKLYPPELKGITW